MMTFPLAGQPTHDRKTRWNPSRQLAVVIAVVFLPFCSPHAVLAQQPSPEITVPDNWDFGFDLFYSMLDAQGLRQQAAPKGSIWGTRLDRVLRNPKKSVLILTGGIQDVDGRYVLHHFIAAGGMVLIATDQSLEIIGFFRTRRGPVQDVDSAQFDYEDCLKVSTETTSHPLVYGVNSLITNRSGWISHFETSKHYRWSTLARLPSTSSPNRSRRMPLLAVAESVQEGSGKLFVLADESIFTNGMLWHGDNQILALNLVRELSAGSRTEMLFLQDGKTVNSRINDMLLAEAAKMDIPPDLIPPEALRDLPAEALLGIGNAVLSDIEDSNILNDLVVDRPRSMPARFYRRAIVFALCGLALIVFLILAWRGSQTLLPWAQSKQIAPASHAAAVVPLNQAAAALARDTCRLLTGSEQADEWAKQMDPSGTVGQQLMNASEHPDDIRQTLSEVVEWSTSTRSTSLSKTQFEEFGQRLYDLRQLKPADERQHVS
jgi:hypothetical protein